MPMNKISRCLVKEFLPLFLIALGFIVFLFSLGTLFQVIDLLVQNLVSGAAILSYAFFIFLELLPYALILATLVAATITFGRFSQDREYLALKSLGIPFKQVVKPLVMVGALISLVNIFLVGFLQPHGLYQGRALRSEARGVTYSPRMLRPGSVITTLPDIVIFIPERGQEKPITFYQRSEEIVRSIAARKVAMVEREGRPALLFEDGITHTYDAKEPETYQKLAFQTYLLPLPVPESRDPPTPRITEQKLHTLWRSPEPDATAEKLRRLSFALAPLVFLVIGIPLGISLPRSTWGIIAACGIVLAYYFALSGLEVIVDIRPHFAWLYFLPLILVFLLGLQRLRN